MDMVLAKSSIAIASRYAELVPDAALRDKIFGRIRREWHGSIETLLDDHGAGPAAAGQSAAGALDPQPLSLSRSAQPRAGRAAEASTARTIPTSRCCAASSSPSTASRRACATAASVASRNRASTAVSDRTTRGARRNDDDFCEVDARIAQRKFCARCFRARRYSRLDVPHSGTVHRSSACVRCRSSRRVAQQSVVAQLGDQTLVRWWSCDARR